MRGALGIHAAACGLIGGFRVFDPFGIFDLDRALAFGAAVGGRNSLCAFGTLVEHDADDLRDDLAGFFDVDGVAKADVGGVGGGRVGVGGGFENAAVVVESGVLDGGAREDDGLHGGAGRDLAGLADLVRDVEEDGGLSLGGVLVRDGPARGFGGEAEALLEVEVVDAQDHAVGGVVE